MRGFPRYVVGLIGTFTLVSCASNHFDSADSKEAPPMRDAANEHSEATLPLANGSGAQHRSPAPIDNRTPRDNTALFQYPEQFQTPALLNNPVLRNNPAPLDNSARLAPSPATRTPTAPAPSVVGTSPAPSTAATPQLAFRPGELVVKYRSTGATAVTEDVEQYLDEGRSFAQATTDRSSSLDGMHRRIGARRAHALLRGRYGVPTRAAKALFTKRSAPAVAQRLSAGAPVPTRNLGELANVYVLELAADADVLTAVADAERDPHVEYAQPNYLAKVNFTPNDPYFSSSGSWEQNYADLWSLERINAPAAWDQTQGEGVLVAVVDSGLDFTHPDVAANVWHNPGEVASNGIDDDGNGYIDDVSGWAFDSATPDATDLYGHGTHVSGIIAAVGDNGVGVVGVAPKAKLLPLRAFMYGYGAMSWLSEAIVYAAQNGAQVINNSWSCVTACPSNPLAEEAIDIAVGLGSTVVFSAGNSAADVGQFSPQNHGNVLVVSASDPDDAIAWFSNFGGIDVAAPGAGRALGPPEYEPIHGVLSLKAANCSPYICPPGLVVGDGYLRLAGTSMATPQVSGAVALLLAQHPEYGSEQVRQVLRHSAVDVGPPGNDTSSGFGRLDVSAALAEPPPMIALLTGPASPITTPGDLLVTGTAGGPEFASYRLEFGKTTTPASYTLIAESNSAATGATLGTWNTDTLPDGTHTLRLQATSQSGVVYEDRRYVTFDRVFLTAPTQVTSNYGQTPPIYAAGTAVELRGNAASGGLTSYDITVLQSDGSPLPGASVTLAGGGAAPVVEGWLGSWDTTAVPLGIYDLVLTAHGAGGDDTASIRVVVDPSLHPGFPVDIDAMPDINAYTNLFDELIAVDLDGDGAAEIGCIRGQFVTFFTHTGQELAGWPQRVDAVAEGFFFGNQAPTVADVTGDEALEVITTNHAGQLFIWNANGELLMEPNEPGSDGYSRFMAIDDLDGDGVNDIVTTAWEPVVRVMHVEDGKLVKTFEQAFSEMEFEQLLTPPAIGDLDGDGTKEIVFSHYDFSVSPLGLAQLYVIGPEGTLPGWPKFLDDGERYTGGTSYPVLGDIDADGQLDVVVTANSGKVFAFGANAEPLPGWPQNVNTVEGVFPVLGVNSPTLGDLDGDGQLEVVVGTLPSDYYYGGELLFAWHGNGQLLDGFPYTSAYPPATRSGGFGSAALADIDGDGRVEAITAADSAVNGIQHALTAVQTDGSTAIGFPKLTAGANPYVGNTSAVADFDGDGQLELAFLDWTGSLYLWDLTASATSARPWPMYQHDPQHTARADAPTTSGLRARLRGGVGSPSDNRIQPRISLVNDTVNDVRLRALTVRYWYTDETAPSKPVFELESASIEPDNRDVAPKHVKATFGAADGVHADRYVEIGFAPQAGKLPAGQSLTLDFTVRARNGKPFKEKNDYSYRRPRSEVDWDRITVYRHGVLIWGVEPPPARRAP